MSNHEFLIFTDCHIHPHKKSEERLRDCLQVLDWVFQTAREKNIKNILFGGDFFHDRTKIDLLTCHETFVAMKKYLDGSINLHMILGNHDLWFYEKSTISSVTILSSLPNVTIYDKPQSVVIDDINWHMLPFTHNPIHDLEILKSSMSKNTFLLGHIAVNGAKLNSAGSVAEIEIENDGDMIKIGKDLFEGYKQAFLGHYHGHQKLSDNLEYIGSPLQLNFGEAGDPKYILHLKINKFEETFEKNYIENTFSPRHYAGSLEQLKKIDKKFVNNCFVSLISENETKEEDDSAIEQLSNMGFKSIKVKKVSKTIEDVEKAITIQTSKSILENSDMMITEYIKHLNPEMDHALLVQVGKKIVDLAIAEGD